MVSTRTTAQSQREVQRLDCSVPGLWLSWLLVVHIVRPLGVALVLYWKQRAWRGQGAAVAGGHRDRDGTTKSMGILLAGFCTSTHTWHLRDPRGKADRAACH